MIFVTPPKQAVRPITFAVEHPVARRIRPRVRNAVLGNMNTYTGAAWNSGMQLLGAFNNLLFRECLPSRVFPVKQSSCNPGLDMDFHVFSQGTKIKF
jgi:hypothetical protein